MAVQIDTITRTQPGTAAALQIPLLVVVSEALYRSLRQVELIEQVGRFVLVNFKTFGFCDPEAIICLEASEEGEQFNAAMRRFQAARWRGIIDPSWYKRVEAAVDALRIPLIRLNPAWCEANFVMGWAAEVRAAGKSI